MRVWVLSGMTFIMHKSDDESAHCERGGIAMKKAGEEPACGAVAGEFNPPS
jgi:hypothetical protein